MLAALLSTLLLGVEPCETGKLLFARKEYALAQDSLWRCVRAATRDTEAAYMLGLTYRELKNYADGLKNVATLPDTVDRLYLRAFLQFRTGNARESCSTLEQAYRRSPEDWRIHHLYGLNYVVLDIKEGAEVSFTNAVRLNPKNAELWYLLARLYYTDNRPQESLTASREALKLAPEYPEVYSNIALCHEALANDAEAVAAFRRAIELSKRLGKTDEWPLLNFAAYLIKQGRSDEATPLLRDALALNAGSAKGHYLIGRALAKTGDAENARKHLEISLALDADTASTYFELGMLLQRLGDREGARANLARFETLRKGSLK